MDQEVFVDGVRMGTAPMQLRLNTNQSYTVLIRSQSVMKERTFTLVNQIGAGWIIRDFLAGLFPIIIDLSTGAWYDLSPGQINVILR